MVSDLFADFLQPDSSFDGSMTFVFDQEPSEDCGDAVAETKGKQSGGEESVPKPELEVSVTIEKVH